MTHHTFIRRSAALMASAALSFIFTPAMAANVVQLGAGQTSTSAIEPGQRLDLPGPAAQVMLDDGGVVSFVGAGSLTVGADGEIVIHSGAATVLAMGRDVRVVLPGGLTAVVAAGGGASTFTPTSRGYGGNVLSGGLTVASGGRSSSFAAGQSWRGGAGAPPARVFANAAQPVVDAFDQNPALTAFPSGDALLLAAFAENLAGLYGGGAFEGAGADLVRAYLSYLAGGGVPADFQADYGALIAQYIALLREGGLPDEFEGPGQAAILAYLDYLRQVGGLEALSAQDRAFVESYLAFLGGGGAGGDFAGFYVQAIQAYLAFLEEGGLPSEYTGLSQALIAQYLALLQSTGLLASLLEGQSEFLLAYLEYIQGGGDPDEFEDLPDTDPGPGPDPDPGPGDPPVTGTVLPQFAAGEYNLVVYALNDSFAFGDADRVSLTFNETDGAPNQLFRYPRTTAKLVAGAGSLSEGWLIGRLGDGTFSTPIQGLNETFKPDEGAHFVVMKTLGTRPQSGLVNYDLHAFTAPTYAGGGTVENATATGRLSIDFGTLKWGFTSQIKFNSANGAMTYDLSMANTGDAMPGMFFMRGQAPILAGESAYMKVATNDPRCASGCTALYSFMVGGGDGELAGGTYVIASPSPVLGGALLFRAGPAAPEPPVSGTERTGQVIAYAGSEIGIDGRAGVTTTTEADGALNKYLVTADTAEAPQRGTNQSLETGTVAGVIGWSRWAGGTAAGRYYDMPDATRTANQGMSLVYGSPATNLPASGTVSYALVGSTKPTIRDGSIAPGTFTGSAAVAFGSTPKVGLDMQVGIGGHTYAVATAGGVGDPGSSQLSVGSNMRFDHYDLSVAPGGPACAGGTCWANVQGFLAGEGASHIGVAYTIGGPGAFTSQVDGVAVFGRP